MLLCIVVSAPDVHQPDHAMYTIVQQQQELQKAFKSALKFVGLIRKNGRRMYSRKLTLF